MVSTTAAFMHNTRTHPDGCLLARITKIRKELISRFEDIVAATVVGHRCDLKTCDHEHSQS